MASKRILIAALAVVVIVVAAGVLVFVYPRLVNTRPSTVPGTSFISTGVVGSSIGGSWQKSFYVSAGTQNPEALSLEYAHLLSNISISQIGLSYQSYPAGASGSLIGYSEHSSGSTLVSFYVDYPNATAASDAYSNITALLQLNSSIHITAGTVSGASYTYANMTGGVNATQVIYSHSGNYLVGFAYNGASAVSESGMVNLVKNQIAVLGSASSSGFPTQLLTEAQLNSALSINADSYAYAIVNVTDLGSLLNTYGNSSSSLGSVATDQFVGNITEAGIVSFGDQANNVTAGSSFVSFKSTTYSSALYELFNTYVTSNSTYSPSYHAGTVGGRQYFYFNASVSPGSAAIISVLVCVDGNSLIVQYAIGSSAYGYQQMSGLASAQISDL